MGVHRRELALGALLALLMLQDAGCFFDKRATVFRTACQNGVQIALPYDGMGARSQTRVMEDVHEVHAARGGAVYEIFAFPASIHTTREGHFREIHRKGSVGIVQHQIDLGDAEAFSCRRPCEYDVFHSLAAQVLGVSLAKNPQHGIGYVRLARTVWTDDRGDSRLEGHDGTVGE